MTICNFAGADLAHAATCRSCSAAIRAIARVERALATIHDDRRPPPGWKTRVLAAARSAPTQPVARWTWPWRRAALALVPLGAAAGLAVLLLARSPTPTPTEHGPALDVTLAPDPGFRGSDGPGVLSARGGGGPRVRTLAVYRGATLVRACPGDATCATDGDGVRLTAPATVTGRYTIVYTASDSPRPPATTLDVDMAAAIAVGAEVVVKTVDVR